MTDPVAVHHETDAVSDPSANAAINKISWGAVFAGVAVALAVQFLLNLLGVGIGAAAIDPATADTPSPSTFSITGGLWFAVSGIVAAFVGGYVASRVSGRPSKTTGSFHGLTSWAVTTLVVLYLLTTSVGALVGGAFSGLSSIIGGVGRTAATVTTAAAPSVDPMADIEQQIRSAIGGNDPAALRDAAVAAVRAVLTGDEATAEEARNRAAEALARAQNIPVDQARAQVQQYEERYKASFERAKQQATEAADTAATVVSSSAILGFVSLVIGAVAAWFGGASGTTRTVVTTDATRRVG